jgi:SAM-dependent methyltransferase
MTQTRSRLFWNLIAGRYARQPVADEAAYRHKLEVTRGLLRPDMRVLEFGCGTGSTALVHAPHVAAYDAIDYSPKMIAIARAKPGAPPQLRFEVASIEDWPAADESYDAVLAMSILHLVENRSGVLARVRRLLRPGGLFLSSTACLGDVPGLGKHILPIGSALRLLPHVTVFTADRLVAEIEAEGFAVDRRWQPAVDKALFLVARRG